MRRFFKFGRHLAGVSGRDCGEVLAAIDAAFGAFRAGRGQCRWEIGVERSGGWFVIRDETGGVYRIGTPYHAWIAVDRLLRAKYTDVLGARRLVLHAGAVARPGRGAVLLLGTCEGGKSSLVSALVAQGWTYLSDELVPLGARGRAAAFPRLPDVDPQMAARLCKRWPQLKRVRAGEAPTGYLRLPRGRRLSPGATENVRQLLFLGRGSASGKPSFRRLGGGAAVRATVRASFNCDRLGPPGIWSAADLVKGARVYRLGYRDVFAQAEQISLGISDRLS
jgi:hypothetical protein